MAMTEKQQETLIWAGIFAALLLVVKNMFIDDSERKIITKYGRYFDSDYFKFALKKIYAKDFAKYKAKGIPERDIMTWIVRHYFDREKMGSIAARIYAGKGTISDNEIKAVTAYSEIKDLIELSYVSALFFQVSTAVDSVVKDSSFLGSIEAVQKAVDEKASSKSKRSMLNYTLSYFNKSHRKALLSLLGKMKRTRPVKKQIPIPSWI